MTNLNLIRQDLVDSNGLTYAHVIPAKELQAMAARIEELTRECDRITAQRDRLIPVATEEQERELLAEIATGVEVDIEAIIADFEQNRVLK